MPIINAEPWLVSTSSESFRQIQIQPLKICEKTKKQFTSSNTYRKLLSKTGSVVFMISGPCEWDFSVHKVGITVLGMACLDSRRCYVSPGWLHIQISDLRLCSHPAELRTIMPTALGTSGSPPMKCVIRSSASRTFSILANLSAMILGMVFDLCRNGNEVHICLATMDEPCSIVSQHNSRL